MASPSPKLGRDDFQDSCWAWLSSGCSPSLMFLPRAEMIEQKCPFILSQVLLLTHSPRFHSWDPFKVALVMQLFTSMFKPWTITFQSLDSVFLLFTFSLLVFRYQFHSEWSEECGLQCWRVWHFALAFWFCFVFFFLSTTLV